MARSVQTPKPATNTGEAATAELPTFLDHIHELRRRLFWVVAVILVTSAAAYPFLDAILAVLTAPLGGQQLYYLTPIGGFSFSIKICFYVGIVFAVPIIMYHLYRYIEPLMGRTMRRSALFYVGLSTLMAAVGVTFAYFVSLPGALHFLTGMDLKNIQAMLTVDSYLTFVMTYLLGAALLFQIPLLLAITNNMTPLQPKKLMGLQRYVIVAAFILAAIISPTPDIMNQLLLALPIIVMYQIGVGLVWGQNRSRAKQARKQALPQPLYEFKNLPTPDPLPAQPAQLRNLVVIAAQQSAAQSPQKAYVRRASMDGFAPARQATPSALKPVTTHAQRPMPVRPAPAMRTLQPASQRPIRVPARSVDGFMLHRPTQIAHSS